MAGKSVEKRLPTSMDELRARINRKYAAELWEHPNGYGLFEVAPIKRHEREQIDAACRGANGQPYDLFLQSRMAAAFGLVSVSLTADDLKNYPDDFIEPVATRVWELSHVGADAGGKGGADSDPFTKRSSAATDSPPPSDG